MHSILLRIVQIVAIFGAVSSSIYYLVCLWGAADFLRRRIKRQDGEKDFDGALEEALKLAKGTDSDYLPGWCGPVTDERLAAF